MQNGWRERKEETETDESLERDFQTESFIYSADLNKIFSLQHLFLRVYKRGIGQMLCRLIKDALMHCTLGTRSVN